MVEIFSNWIFIWFILYCFNIITYNPLGILIIAYIFTFLELIYLSQTNISKYNFIKFFTINVILKFIPILLIFKYPLNIQYDDLMFGLYLLLFYIFVMSYLNKNPYIFYKNLLNTYINDDDGYKSYISITYDKIINYSYNI